MKVSYPGQVPGKRTSDRLWAMPLLAATGPDALDEAIAILGVLLVCGALFSGVAHRSFLALTPLYVIAGFLLGEGGLEVIEFDPTSGFVGALTVIALIVILFRDGLEVESEMLQEAWHPPVRKLVLAMPITAGLVACAVKLLTDLDWTEAFSGGRAPGTH